MEIFLSTEAYHKLYNEML